MELNLSKHSVTLLVILCAIRDTYAKYCKYMTPDEVYKFAVCDQTCCKGENLTYENVCCPFVNEKGASIGGAVVGITIGGMVVIFAMYICYNRSKYGTGQTRARSGHTTGHSSPAIPSISAQVHVTMPPAYDDLPPPPYSTKDLDEWIKKHEQAYPTFAPPSYSETIGNA